jgi:hypothetical protein
MHKMEPVPLSLEEQGIIRARILDLLEKRHRESYLVGFSLGFVLGIATMFALRLKKI